MERTVSSELHSKVGQKVLVKGWMHFLRKLGAVNFLHLRDRGGLVQIVIEDKEELQKVKDLQPGSVLAIEAFVQKANQTEIGVELVSPDIEVEVEVRDALPVDITKKEIHANLDTMLDYRGIVLRNEKQQAIFKLQAGILKGFRVSMEKRGFTEFVSPLLMGVPSESGADVFEVKYFENTAYLAQSPQIYKQIMTGVFERVYTISKAFRAEKHNTSRHLMEITQIDGEMGFVESYDEVLDEVEGVIRDIFELLKDQYPKELSVLGVELPILPAESFPRVKVREAFGVIEKRTGKSAKRDELDVDPEDEREIAKWAREEFQSDFVWLLNFKSNKNFYTWDNPEDEKESLSFDLVCKGLEWLSGTHRIHKYELLLERLKSQGLSPENFEHYLQAFKYGMPSEAGFSLGLERMTQQIAGLDNIREATLFPSDLRRIAATRIGNKVLKGEREVVSKIREVLDVRGIEYDYREHEPTPTSEDSARVRGTSIDQGVKALILKGKKDGENVLVCVGGAKKIDMKKLASVAGQRFSFESAEMIEKKYGLKIGGIPPFGGLLGLKVYFDEGILDQEAVAFNCGSQSASIIMNPRDLVDLVGAEVVDLS